MGLLSVFFRSRESPPSQPLPRALFPATECTTSVDAWANSIQDMPQSHECRLRRIAHCKVKSGSRDEFLLIYVRHPSGKDAVVLSDRGTSFDPPSAYTDEDGQTEIRALGITPNRDRVRLSPTGSEASLTRHIAGGWAEIHTVKFPKPSEAPSVAHFAALLTVVHRHAMSPGASAEARSGWFAYCVAEVMRETFLGKSKTSKGWVRVSYGGMKVDGRDTVEALTREFRPAWDDFSRQQTARGGGRSIAEHTSKRQAEKKGQKGGQMNSFVDMLRTMDL